MPIGRRGTKLNIEFYHEFLHYVDRNIAMGNKSYFERKLKLYPNGHGTVLPMAQSYERVGFQNRADKPLPDMKSSELRILLLFPDTYVLVRTTAIRIDMTTPIGPNQTLVEQRGFGIKGESEDVRSMGVKPTIFLGGGLAAILQKTGLRLSSSRRTSAMARPPYGIFARREDLICTDDALIRNFYEEWGKYMGHPAHNPTNVMT